MEKLDEALSNGQRRSIRIKYGSAIAKEYLNNSSQFMINEAVLKLEQRSEQTVLQSHTEALGKNVSSADLLKVFESMDSEDEEEQPNIDQYLSNAEDGTAKTNTNKPSNRIHTINPTKRPPPLDRAQYVPTGSSKKCREDEEPKANESCVSIYSYLKGKFGRFELFHGAEVNGKLVKISAEWIDYFESFLVKKYASADGIILHFFGFISKKLFGWYFALDFDKLKMFADFKLEFLKEVQRLEFEHRNLIFMTDSAQVKKLADKYPLT